MTATVASHRRTRHHPLAPLAPTGGTARGARTARTATVLALAGAATATAFDGTVQAAPELTPAQVQDRVDTLYQEAEVATQKYNGAKEQADAAREELGELQDEAARRTLKLNAAKAGLGTMAAGQYRSGGVDPTVRLLLSADPQRYLDGATVLERAGSHQANAVAGYARRLGSIRQVRERAEETAERLADTEAALKKHRVTVVRKLDSAERLLDRLTVEQRQGMANEDGRRREQRRRLRRGGGLPGAQPPCGASCFVCVYRAGQALRLGRDRPLRVRLLGPDAGRVAGRRDLPAPYDLHPDQRGLPHRADPNSPLVTWCSSTPGSATSASTSATAR